MPERQQNAPLKVLKLSGVILMIPPFFIVFGMTVDLWNNRHNPLVNTTLEFRSCDYRKSFLLTKNLRVGVCLYQDSVLLHFKRDPSLKKLPLTAMEWQSLKPYVDSSMESRRDSAVNKTERVERTIKHDGIPGARRYPGGSAERIITV